MAAWVVAYRHAAYDTPWWASPSSRSGRFHRAITDTVQYLSLHPLGPAAEFLRHNIGPTGDPDHARLNLWAVRADVEGCVRVTFDDCLGLGITADQLVGEDYGPTQALAARLRVNAVPGMIVPSAALSGTENLVLFGPRVAHPYLAEPFSDVECPTGHLSDGAWAPAEVAALVRWIGTPHSALDRWKAGRRIVPFPEPLATRW